MSGKRKNGQASDAKGAYQFSKRGPCLNSMFLASVKEVQNQKGLGSFTDLSQRQYLIQCNQRAQSGESLIPLLAETDLKIDHVKRNQRQLNHLQKDQSLFASKEDQVSQLNIQIKDALTWIQVDQEEIQEAASRMSKQVSGAHKRTVQAGIDTLNFRMLGIAADFKSFLEQHQKVVKKQEAKKERIIGAGSGSSGKNSSYSGGGGRSNQVQQATSLSNKRKMKILPQHMSQQANRMMGSRGISGADYAGIPNDNDDGGMMGGCLEMEEQQNQRNQSIESVEKTLYDILNLFKRFGTIVQNHEALVARIDLNAEEACYDVEEAQKQLREVYEDTSNNRTLMLKIFFILIIFVVFYILFIL